MKISELFEATVDSTANIEALEQTQEFKQFSKKFDLVSTRQQRKNGTLVFVSKPHLHKETRDFIMNFRGEIKVKNGYANMYSKAGYATSGGPGSLEQMLEAIRIIENNYDEWFAKRKEVGLRKGSDVSNLNLSTLEGLGLPALVKKDFNCSSNSLTSLIGAPEILATENFFCGNNDLVSPLEGAPKECSIFNVQTNKLTTCEGFPRKAHAVHMGKNEFTTYKGIEKNFDYGRSFSITANHNGKPLGLLSFFKVKGCVALSSASGNSEQDKQAIAIVYKHLSSPERNAIACQKELYDNDLDDYAEF
jgi:hypothetical protein